MVKKAKICSFNGEFENEEKNNNKNLIQTLDLNFQSWNVRVMGSNHNNLLKGIGLYEKCLPVQRSCPIPSKDT